MTSKISRYYKEGLQEWTDQKPLREPALTVSSQGGKDRAWTCARLIQYKKWAANDYAIVLTAPEKLPLKKGKYKSNLIKIDLFHIDLGLFWAKNIEKSKCSFKPEILLLKAGYLLVYILWFATSC
jgi:hypothetical protein